MDKHSSQNFGLGLRPSSGIDGRVSADCVDRSRGRLPQSSRRIGLGGLPPQAATARLLF